MLAPLVWSCCTAAAAAATAFSPPAYVALHVPDVAPLDARLRALSHPSSPEYGHWLTSAEVARLAHPPLEQQHAVLAWLGRFANVSLLQNCGDVIKVWADASTLQAMWGGTWTTDGCLAGYVIPAPLRTLVAFVELCLGVECRKEVVQRGARRNGHGSFPALQAAHGDELGWRVRHVHHGLGK